MTDSLNQSTKLKELVVTKIKANPVLIGRLASHFKVSLSTINRWLNSNHPYLVFMESLIIISQELQQQSGELVENVVTAREGVEI